MLKVLVRVLRQEEIKEVGKRCQVLIHIHMTGVCTQETLKSIQNLLKLIFSKVEGHKINTYKLAAFL